MVKKHIAFVSNFFPSLSETFIYREVIGLRKRGLSIKTFSIRKPDIKSISKESHELHNTTTYLIPIDVFRFLKAHVYYFTSNPIRYVYLFVFLMTRKFERKIIDRKRTLFHFLEGVYLAKLIKEHGSISHIHAHYASHPSTLALVASALTGIPFSFTAHAHDIWLDKLFIEDKIKLAKFVITCSEFGRKSILQINNIDSPDKITTIYHGIDTKKFFPKIYNKTNSPTTLLNVARLSEEKAHNNLIMACKNLKDEGYNFQCIIAGDGPLLKNLKEQIENLKLDETVKLVGRVLQEEVIDYYQNADIFVLPSNRENLPNVLLESLASGVPVIASNIAGIPELINNRQNGILINPNCLRELVESIKLLIDDKELTIKMGKNGRDWVCSKFDAEMFLNQILELYRMNDLI